MWSVNHEHLVKNNAVVHTSGMTAQVMISGLRVLRGEVKTSNMENDSSTDRVSENADVTARATLGEDGATSGGVWRNSIQKAGIKSLLANTAQI